MKRWMLFSLLGLVPGCVIGGSATTTTDDTGASDNDGGGGDNIDQWRAKGRGKVFLLDGSEDHSLVSVEITGTMEPEAGTAYYGWLRGGESGDLFLGELPVSGDTILHEVDVGLNAFREGYTTFEAYASAGEPSAPGEGTALWHGNLPEDAVARLETLFVDGGVSGEGTLRDLQDTIQFIHAYGQAQVDVYPGDAAMKEAHEAITAAVTGVAIDMTDDGTASTIDGLPASIRGDEGLLTGVEADVEDAFEAFGGNQADDYVRVAFVDAGTCSDNIGQWLDEALRWNGTGTVCGAESACITYMQNSLDYLAGTLVGIDEDGSGDIGQDEGTIDCTIEALSKLMGFDVAI